MQGNYLGMLGHMKYVLALDAKKLVLGVLCLLVISGCADASKDRVEKIVGSKLPNNRITIKEAEKWVEPTGNGYKIIVFELQDKESWISNEECQLKGLTVGKLDDINLSVKQAKLYIDPSSTLCYKTLQSSEDHELVILQGKVVFYFFNDF